MRPLRLEELAGKRPRKKGNDDAERLLLWQIKQYGLTPPISQYLFAMTLKRQWRWDFAWTSEFLALEVQGGIWTRGAHGHPEDILRNMLKHNDAALLGWRWLQFTPEQVKDGSAVLFLQRYLLGNQGGNTCESLPEVFGPGATRPSGTASASTIAPSTVLARRRSKRWKSAPKVQR